MSKFKLMNVETIIPESHKDSTVGVNVELIFKDKQDERLVHFITYDGNILDRCRFSVGNVRLTESGELELNGGFEVEEVITNLLNSIMRHMGDSVEGYEVEDAKFKNGEINVVVYIVGDTSKFTSIFENEIGELYSTLDGYLVSTVDKTFDTRFTPNEIKDMRIIYTVVEKDDCTLPNFRVVHPELIEGSDSLYDVKMFDRFERKYNLNLERTLNLGGIGRRLIDEFELEKKKLFPLDTRLSHEGIVCYCHRDKSITLYATLQISLDNLKEIIRSGRFYDTRLKLDSNYRLFYIGENDDYNDIIVEELGKQISDVVE